MIEVDSLRRPFHIGHFEQSAIGPHPLSAPLTAPLEKTRVLVHWNNEPDKAAKSGGEDDEDDEYRPFTPPPPRERLSYTRYQLELLNGIYHEVRYPNSTQKQLIAKRVGITREQVKIWFQNRRRKDVVGTGKTKQGDDSISSVNSNSSSSSSSKDSEKADDNESLSDESTSEKDSDESVVPNVVLKSVIAELKRFINDPLKGKKNRKKAKTKQKEKAAIKKGLATTLLTGGYDMISPPNQITPSAFFEKMKNGFNHSKGSSAFESPRDVPRPLQINGVSSSSDNSPTPVSDSHDNTKTSPVNTSSYGNYLPNTFMPNSFSNIPLQSHPPSNLPVLSDFSYKSCLEARQKDIMSSSTGPHSTHYSSASTGKNENERNVQPSGLPMGPAPPARFLGGFFPYPFIAEQPVILSSVRQPDQIFRPSPHYALPKFSEDPYQPLMISSLSNPYYSPPSSASWTSHTIPNPTTYTNL